MKYTNPTNRDRYTGNVYKYYLLNGNFSRKYGAKIREKIVVKEWSLYTVYSLYMPGEYTMITSTTNSNLKESNTNTKESKREKDMTVNL